jgi:CDP-diacylglycerol--glycerol-3-phosphate 3-phosphatidyltransferase
MLAMNLPNKITLSRVLAVPLFMLFIVPFPDGFLYEPIQKFLELYGKYIATAIFIISSSTDGVDGYIARKKKMVTNFGKFLDPIADKMLVTAALVALVQRNELSAWVAVIIIGRDLIVTGLRLVAAAEGVVLAASIWGKIKTLSQMVAIVAIMLDNFPLSYISDIDFGQYAMIIAVAATIYSGIDYIRKNINILNYNE